MFSLFVNHVTVYLLLALILLAHQIKEKIIIQIAPCVEQNVIQIAQG